MTTRDHKPVALEDIPVLDPAKVAIAPWEPGSGPDGIREETPPLYKDLLGLLGWGRRRGEDR